MKHVGKIIQVRCTKCGFEKELFAGGGISDCKLKTILDALDKDKQKALADEINHGAKHVSITRQLCVCGSCSTVQVIPIVTYSMDGVTKTITGNCPHCGKAGDDLQKETNSGRCPECGAPVTVQQGGHWD